MNEIRKFNHQPIGDKSDLHALVKQMADLFPNGQIKKVLLVTPPDADSGLFRFETAKRGRYTNYPPYGLGIVAEKLRRIGVDVKLCNLNQEILRTANTAAREQDFDHDATWQAKLDDVLEDFEPDFVGVTCMFTMTHESLKRVCNYIAEKNYVVSIGGVHVSNDVEHVLDDVPAVSFAFLREAEGAIANFVRCINGTSEPESLGQMIAVLPSVGAPNSTERHYFMKDCRPEADDVDVTPAYDLMEIPEYSRYGTIGAFYCFKPKDAVFATVLSNRGCRAQCTFCSVRNFNGKGVRGRDPIQVVDEIEELVNTYGVDHIMWLDDDLLKDHRRAITMFDEIARRNLGITWDATNGLIASSCTDEVVDAMAKSGCIAVNIGMESGNAGILREIRKPGTVDVFLEAARVLRKYEEIHTSVLLMVGFPRETFRMVQDTIDVAREMDCDWYRISPLQPLPNTPIHDAMVEQGIIKDEKAGEVRFMGGSYGKQAEIEKGQRPAEALFASAFAGVAPDDVLTPGQITDMWFYMNYTLNFHRIFFERRPVKLAQLRAHLQTLSEVISPENGFALYFQGFLQCLENGEVDQTLIDRFERRLAESEYWRERLAAFGLRIEDLKTGEFPMKDAPAMFDLFPR